MKLHRWLSAATVAAVAVSLSACASSERDSATSSSAPSASGDATGETTGGDSAGGDGIFTFGAPGKPSTFDPFYASDGETFRVARQITEGLTAFKSGTTELEGALAESWEQSPDGLEWTFKIRQGVTFHDGEKLDAAAVCFNYDRMYNQKPDAGAPLAEYWTDNMGGFKDQVDEDGNPVTSLYKSCTASDESTAVIALTQASSRMPFLTALPSYAIQSPKALTDYKADDVKAEGDSYAYPEYALAHPTGTGPFTFGSYDTANETITLNRNDNYWGEKAKSKTLIFQVISDESARRQAFEAGTIDGYDFPSPGDLDSLKASGAKVETRDAFNIMYLGLNPTHNPALLDLKVRQAIAYALNRPEFVSSQLPEGAEVAIEYNPESVEGYTDSVQKYDYDPEKAKALLAEAGASDLTLNFWWPTNVSRPYMPDPKSVFTAFKADLEAVGITINETSKIWGDGYLTGVEKREPDAFLLGWTGDFPAAINFTGSFFSDPTGRFGIDLYPFADDLAASFLEADAEPDTAKRSELFAAINEKLLGEYLPAIPISHSPPSIVVAANVEGLIASPLTDERFAGVYKTS